MSRFIDSQPVHPNPREKKVIILSFGRNGTFGFYNALKVLGYNPYHQVEVFKNGVPHLRMQVDAIRAGFKGEGARFTREDFDKWFGDYDSVTDVPAFFLKDLVAAYPEAKFILTERDPAAWRKSVSKTFLPMAETFASPMFRTIAMLDPYTYHLTKLGDVFSDVMFGGHMGSPEEREKGLDQAVAVYNNHNKMVKELIPADKLLVLKLEDGLGWEQICSWLGHDVPDIPYPRVNESEEFQRLAMGDLKANWTKTGIKVVSVIIPIISASVWFWRRR